MRRSHALRENRGNGFCLYRDAASSTAFLTTAAYRDYEHEVTPLLLGPLTSSSLSPSGRRSAQVTNGEIVRSTDCP